MHGCVKAYPSITNASTTTFVPPESGFFDPTTVTAIV
jgi:hypothetical protein